MSSATDELRRLLDGRGIEHMDFNMPDKFLTMFGGGEHDGAYTENSVDTILTVCGASPEQAVEATLGRGTCEILGYDDGYDEGLDGEMYQYADPRYFLSCEHEAYGSVAPNYCPVCGRKVVDA